MAPNLVLCAMCILPYKTLQTAAPVLHKVALGVSSKVVALHFDNSIVKIYLCNQGGIVSLYL